MRRADRRRATPAHDQDICPRRCPVAAAGADCLHVGRSIPAGRRRCPRRSPHTTTGMCFSWSRPSLSVSIGLLVPRWPPGSNGAGTYAKRRTPRAVQQANRPSDASGRESGWQVSAARPSHEPKLCEQSAGSASVPAWGRRAGPLPSTRLRLLPDPRVRAGACPAPRAIGMWQSARPVAALVTIPLGRRRERRATRHGRDPDARFLPKRSRARGRARRGGDLGAGRARFDACFHAIGGVQARRSGRVLSWRTSSQKPHRSNSTASDGDLAPFDLRVIRAMQSSARARRDR